MRISHVEAIAVRLPMHRPMKMAGVEIRHADNLLVRLQADSGLVGWGEAASAPTMTGELVQGMHAAVQHLAAGLVGQPVAGLGAAGAWMDHQLHGNTSAKAAIDMAWHDLLGKTLQLPLHALLGGLRRSRVPALWMLGTGTLQGDVDEARTQAADGCVAFKIKVGIHSVEADAERTRAVCSALDTDVLVCADANQAWSFEQAAAYLAGIGDAPLAFLEQPLRGDDIEGMQGLAASSRVALGCDEGVHGLADIRRHHEQRAASGCSLKLIKLGGLRTAHEAALLCDRLGMKVNLACKIAESSIATAAVLHLAACIPALDWGLSLSSQYLAEDLVRQPLQVAHGWATVPEGHGLGIDVDEAQVDRFRQSVRAV